jgi:hypothetical protein
MLAARKLRVPGCQRPDTSRTLPTSWRVANIGTILVRPVTRNKRAIGSAVLRRSPDCPPGRAGCGSGNNADRAVAYEGDGGQVEDDPWSAFQLGRLGRWPDADRRWLRVSRSQQQPDLARPGVAEVIQCCVHGAGRRLGRRKKFMNTLLPMSARLADYRYPVRRQSRISRRGALAARMAQAHQCAPNPSSARSGCCAASPAATVGMT